MDKRIVAPCPGATSRQAVDLAVTRAIPARTSSGSGIWYVSGTPTIGAYSSSRVSVDHAVRR